MKQPTLKQPKTVELRVLVPYWLLSTLLTLVIGLIAGWYSGIELHGNTRATVMQEITASQSVVKK